MGSDKTRKDKTLGACGVFAMTLVYLDVCWKWGITFCVSSTAFDGHPFGGSILPREGIAY